MLTQRCCLGLDVKVEMQFRVYEWNFFILMFCMFACYYRRQSAKNKEQTDKRNSGSDIFLCLVNDKALKMD